MSGDVVDMNQARTRSKKPAVDVSGYPKPPSWLGAKKAVKDLWYDNCRHLDGLGIGLDDNLESLAHYVSVTLRLREAQRKTEAVSPSLLTEYRRLAAEFYATPKSLEDRQLKHGKPLGPAKPNTFTQHGRKPT